MTVRLKFNDLRVGQFFEWASWGHGVPSSDAGRVWRKVSATKIVEVDALPERTRRPSRQLITLSGLSLQSPVNVIEVEE